MADAGAIPETRYATLGDDRIAYQVFGDGDVDLIFLPASGDCIGLRWDWPGYSSFLRHLATQARVISLDRRGSGESDAPSSEPLPSWEMWADDARAVLDAVSSERAVIFGNADSGPTAILFAASHPSRTRGLILSNTTARFAAAPGYPGVPEDVLAQMSAFVQEAWGTDALIEYGIPDTAARDSLARYWYRRSQRFYMPPREAAKFLEGEQVVDVRDALASVQVPTLVIHRSGFEPIPSAQGRYLYEHIEGATFVLIEGRDGLVFTEPADEALASIDAFLRGLKDVAEPDRALAAILYTDIVGSTERLSAMGDREWRNLLDSHDVVARTIVEQHRGKIVKLTGDGILATFDGPGRAIRCAITLGDALRPLGLEIRAGLHTGEVELRGADIAGIGAHIAARVLEAAQPGELLVSAAVPMLVAGSGIEFVDRGEHELKGVPGGWRLFAVEN